MAQMSMEREDEASKLMRMTSKHEDVNSKLALFEKDSKQEEERTGMQFEDYRRQVYNYVNKCQVQEFQVMELKAENERQKKAFVEAAQRAGMPALATSIVSQSKPDLEEKGTSNPNIKSKQSQKAPSVLSKQ